MTTSGKELFIRFTASAFRKLLSIHVFSYFHFGFEVRMWDLIISVPNHCLSFYFLFCMWTSLQTNTIKPNIKPLDKNHFGRKSNKERRRSL